MDTVKARWQRAPNIRGSQFLIVKDGPRRLDVGGEVVGIAAAHVEEFIDDDDRHKWITFVWSHDEDDRRFMHVDTFDSEAKARRAAAESFEREWDVKLEIVR